MQADPARPSRIPAAALALGLGGLAPFFAGAAALWMGWRLPAVGAEAGPALQAYAAVILSFLGGVRWGLALSVADARAQGLELALSVLPSIAAWAALLAPAPWGIAALAVLFLLLGLADLGLARLGAPGWFVRLRLLLTAIVVPSLLAGLAALLR